MKKNLNIYLKKKMGQSKLALDTGATQIRLEKLTEAERGVRTDDVPHGHQRPPLAPGHVIVDDANCNNDHGHLFAE